uniref:Uncharacterized protein n=1 Tax=Anopheles quadriannulatus TaxID=34691 RepID=A0A182XPX2_ANOQN
MSPLFKMTKRHLTLSSQERQNVRRAAELFSRSTAILLQRYCEDEKLLAHFIETASLQYKRSFTGREDQIKALDYMYYSVSNMVPDEKRNMPSFQKNIVMQITSLKMLFDDINNKHNSI